MKLEYVILISILHMLIASCEKDKLSSKQNLASSLIVVNGVIGGENLKLNNNERDSARGYNFKIFSIPSGIGNVELYSTKNLKTPYYSQQEDLEPGGVYSLFLSGTPSAIKANFKREEISEYYADSTVGIRIVNLSSNSNSLNVTLASAPTNSIFSNVSYNEVTNIVKIPLPNAVPANNVTFQIRDAVNTLLTSYTLPASANSTYPNISVHNSRNHNMTLVIKGVLGTTVGIDAFGVFPVANY